MSTLLIPNEPDTSDQRSSRFLRMTGVRRMTGLGRSTIYRLMAAREFPSPVQLSSRAVGWRLSDLEQWSRARKPRSTEMARSRAMAPLPADWPRWP